MASYGSVIPPSHTQHPQTAGSPAVAGFCAVACLLGAALVGFFFGASGAASGLAPRPGRACVARVPITSVMALLLSINALPAAASSLRVVDEVGTPVPGAVIFAPANTARTPSGDHAIDQRNKRFTPLVTVAPPGARVAFPNSDDIRHHVYSFSEGNAFERKLYRANEAEPVTFAAEGVAALGCNIHDNMQAFVLVTPRPTWGVSNGDGVVTGVSPSPGNELRVWHPLLNTRGDAVVLPVATDEAGPRVVLPLRWQDPQARKSASDLEALLRRFSDEPR